MAQQLILYSLHRGLLIMNNYNFKCQACSQVNQINLDTWQSYTLNNVAKAFIKLNKIKPGYGLAKYLQLPPSLDNHASIGEWLALVLADNAYSFKELKVMLKNKVPVEYLV